MSDEKKRFILDSKKSLYDPVEIEIDGTVYKSRRLSRPLLKELQSLQDKAIAAGDIDSVYEQMGLLFDVDQEALDIFDVREIKDILNHAREQMFGSGGKKNEPAKNVPRPRPKRRPK